MSEAAPAANNTTPAAPPAGGPQKSKLVPILLVTLIVVLLGAVGALSFLVLKSGTHKAAPEEHAETAEAKHEAPAPVAHGALPGPTLRLPEFTVRLRNPEQDRFARMAFEIELTEEIDKDKITKRQARIRDQFIRYLSDRSIEELRGSEALERVKSELHEMLVEIAPDARIRALYLTDFVVQ